MTEGVGVSRRNRAGVWRERRGRLEELVRKGRVESNLGYVLVILRGSSRDEAQRRGAKPSSKSLSFRILGEEWRPPHPCFVA